MSASETVTEEWCPTDEVWTLCDGPCPDGTPHGPSRARVVLRRVHDHCCPQIMRTTRDGCWVVCRCGWTSDLYERAGAASVAWSRHYATTLHREPDGVQPTHTETAGRGWRRGLLAQDTVPPPSGPDGVWTDGQQYGWSCHRCGLTYVNQPTEQAARNGFVMHRCPNDVGEAS